MLEAHWDPSDVDTLFFDWSCMIGNASITSSLWDIPSGWELHAQYINQQAAIGDEVVTANGALLSAPGAEGPYRIANMISLSDGRVYERSVFVYVRDI